MSRKKQPDVMGQGLAAQIVKGMVEKVTNTNNSWKGGYTYTAKDSHFRFPFYLDKDHAVYLSSHRGHAEERAKEGARQVDMGIYLDSTWKSSMQKTTSEIFLSAGLELPSKVRKTWEPPAAPLVKGVYLPWRDMSAPTLPQLKELTQWISELIDEGQKIEIACIGGHGRTGTLAAALLLHRHPDKLKANHAIEFVRDIYCDWAIESQAQVDILYKFTGDVPPPPAKSKSTKWTPPASKQTAITNVKTTNAGITMDDANAIREILYERPATRLALYWLDGAHRRKEVRPALVTPAPRF